MLKIGAYIGRFQTPVLTHAQQLIIKRLIKDYDRVTIIIVEPSTKTERNPFSFAEVKDTLLTFIAEYKLETNITKLVLYESLKETRYEQDFINDLTKLLIRQKTMTDDIVKIYTGDEDRLLFKSFKDTDNIEFEYVENIHNTWTADEYRRGQAGHGTNKNTYNFGVCSVYNNLKGLFPIYVRLLFENKSIYFMSKFKENSLFTFPEFELNTIDESLENTLKLTIKYNFENITENDFYSLEYVSSFKYDNHWKYRTSTKIIPLCLVFLIKTKDLVRFSKNDVHNQGYISPVYNNLHLIHPDHTETFKDLI